MVAALGGDARAAGAAAPKPEINVAKLTKAEEAIFTLQPGKDAFVKLAAALAPFRPVVDHVADALSWRSTRKAMAAQAAFTYAVLYPYVIIPGILLTLGTCTLTNRKEDEGSGDEDDGETRSEPAKKKPTPAEPKGASWRSRRGNWTRATFSARWRTSRRGSSESSRSRRGKIPHGAFVAGASSRRSSRVALVPGGFTVRRIVRDEAAVVAGGAGAAGEPLGAHAGQGRGVREADAGDGEWGQGRRLGRVSNARRCM